MFASKSKILELCFAAAKFEYLSGCVRLSLEQRNVILMQCAKLPGKIQFRELVLTIQQSPSLIKQYFVDIK